MVKTQVRALNRRPADKTREGKETPPVLKVGFWLFAVKFVTLILWFEVFLTVPGIKD